jgi:predicted MPP superfamily phosphohydrolase
MHSPDRPTHDRRLRLVAPDSPADGLESLAASAPVSRRSWLNTAARATGVLLAGCAIDALAIEPHWLEFVERDMPTANLPPRWEGKTLAQISDIHVGHRVSDDFLLESFQRVGELRPDIVAITGDFLTLNPGRSVPLSQVERVCRRLPQGQTATVAILGNHDYGWKWSDPSVAQQVVDILGGCGVRVLRNAVADLDGLQVVGLDDLWGGRCDIDTGLAGSAPEAARVVLCHNPDAADLAGWGDYRGWILSGHTHGGQCRLPMLRAPIVPVRNRRYIAGEVDLFDGRKLYINRALGHSYRVRFNVRPEITLFRLTSV